MKNVQNDREGARDQAEIRRVNQDKWPVSSFYENFCENFQSSTFTDQCFRDFGQFGDIV